MLRAAFIAFCAVLAACDGASLVGGIADRPPDVFAGSLDGAHDGMVMDRGETVMTDAATEGDADAVMDADRGDGADLSHYDRASRTGDAPEDHPQPDASSVDDGGASSLATVETITATEISVGQQIAVTCLARDRRGGLLVIAQSRFAQRFTPELNVRMENGVAIAVLTGPLEVRCVHLESDVSDETPVRVTVLPGRAAEVRTAVTPDSRIAGETAEVRCMYVDGEGNVVPAPPGATTVVSVPAEGTRIEGARATLERAGTIELRCTHPGLSTRSARVRVRPSGAAALRIEQTPRGSPHYNGTTILFDGIVTDRFANVVANHPVTWSVPAEAERVDGRVNALRFARQGEYTVRAAATGAGNAPLNAEVTFRVDSIGPLLRCDTPTNNTMLEVRPGMPIVVQGHVDDPFGVERVLVRAHDATAYTEVPVGPDGRWTATIAAARFGLNYLNVTAYDRNGVPSVDLCTYLVAERWLPEDAALGAATAISMSQSGLDDGAPATPVTSFNDVLQGVLTGPSLASLFTDGIARSNPLFDGCLISFMNCAPARVEATSLALRGPNTSSMTFVDGGVRLGIVLQDIRLNVQSTGVYNGPAEIIIPLASVSAVFDVPLTSGRMRSMLRGGSTQVIVQPPRIVLPGVGDQFNQLVTSQVGPRIQTAIESSVQSVILAQMGALLDGLLGSFDVRNLSGTFQTGGSDGVIRTFQIENTVNSVSIDPSRVRMTTASRLRGPVVRTTASRGIALPEGSDRLPSSVAPMSLGLNVGFLNQVLHAMWRAGTLDSEAMTTILGATGLVRIRVLLPPVLHRDVRGDFLVDLGGIEFSMAMFDPPIAFRFGVRMRSSPALVDRAIQFGAFEIVELYSALLNVPASPAFNDNAQRYLLPFVQTFTGDALGRAVPRIPAPTFVVTRELVTLGLQPGDMFGMQRPRLSNAEQFLRLEGGFGAVGP